jgi:pimeloyl-ACP methyl ester carboxylesterase
MSRLGALAPGLEVLAVDLPGRRSTPGDLSSLTLGDCVESVLTQIEQSGIEQLVLVGHSLAGLLLPAVATALGVARCQRLVFIACAVPPEDGTLLDVLEGPLRTLAALGSRPGAAPRAMPGRLAALLACNGMSRSQRRFATRHLYPEAPGLVRQRVSRVGLPRAIPRTWVMTTDDRMLPVTAQAASIANLGGVDELVEIDSCHDVMIKDPDRIATLLATATRLRVGSAG